jgi:hypothetical protein
VWGGVSNALGSLAEAELDDQTMAAVYASLGEGARPIRAQEGGRAPREAGDERGISDHHHAN